jgi:hypothetical protein
MKCSVCDNEIKMEEVYDSGLGTKLMKPINMAGKIEISEGDADFYPAGEYIFCNDCFISAMGVGRAVS